MRLLSPILFAALLIPAAVTAQSVDVQQPGVGQALGQGEQGDPETQPQGVRPPTAETSGETSGNDLQSALHVFYRAPPDLAGNPMPRPNWLASNPDQPTDPSVSANPSDLTSREVK